MTDTPILLTAEIGVGSLVRLRTEPQYPWRWTVCKVGRWWPNRGKLLIAHQTDAYVPRFRWVYPAEVELVTKGGAA